MSVAGFREILRCNGVDQNATPHPVMLVPFGGENQVVLETAGLDLKVQNSTVRVQEFYGPELTSELLRGVQEALSKPDVDPQQRDAFMPNMAWDKPRFFRILGTIKTGLPGTLVNMVPRWMAEKPSATLQVVVVDRMVVKVAIRNVRARDAQGQMRFHAKRPCDPAKEIAQMNAIWTPQTNIFFELVPSPDLDIDQNDPNTREEFTKAYGMKDPATFSAEGTVWADKNWGPFTKHKVPGSHMTFFVVHKLHSGGDPVYGRGGETPNGVMNRPLGISFIADSRLPSTFAHEAGHFVGDMSHDGTDTKLLMRGEGSGYQIPFALAKRFRESLAKRRIA
ncbi:MAG TPA: hypothetical protein VL882_20025 [Vicinamibacterales bacterium]|nr:hypothetical protein [Vicinamibacterales bacterium]